MLGADDSLQRVLSTNHTTVAKKTHPWQLGPMLICDVIWLMMAGGPIRHELCCAQARESANQVRVLSRPYVPLSTMPCCLPPSVWPPMPTESAWNTYHCWSTMGVNVIGPLQRCQQHQRDRDNVRKQRIVNTAERQLALIGTRCARAVRTTSARAADANAGKHTG